MQTQEKLPIYVEGVLRTQIEQLECFFVLHCKEVKGEGYMDYKNILKEIAKIYEPNPKIDIGK